MAFGGPVITIGTGPDRVAAAGAALARKLGPGDPAAMVGAVAGLSGHLWPGHLVVATELRTTEDATPRALAGVELLAGS